VSPTLSVLFARPVALSRKMTRIPFPLFTLTAVSIHRRNRRAIYFQLIEMAYFFVNWEEIATNVKKGVSFAVF